MKMIIIIMDIIVPEKDKRKAGVKIVPKKIFPKKTFVNPTIKVSLNDFWESKNNVIEFANPIFINGKGFGIKVSSAKKDMEIADKKARYDNLLLN